MIKYMWIIILVLIYLRAIIDCIATIILIHKLHVKKGRRIDCFWSSITPLTMITISGTVVIILFYSFSSWLGNF